MWRKQIRSVLTTALVGWTWPAYLSHVKVAYLLRVRNVEQRGTPYENLEFLEMYFVRGWRIDGTSKFQTEHPYGGRVHYAIAVRSGS